jgi:hypothetical protein
LTKTVFYDKVWAEEIEMANILDLNTLNLKETKLEEKDPNVFVLPGIGKYFRLFLALIAGLCATGFIAGGIIGIFSLPEMINTANAANREMIEALGLAEITILMLSGVFAFYVTFVNKGTRLIYPT